MTQCLRRVCICTYEENVAVRPATDPRNKLRDRQMGKTGRIGAIENGEI